MLHRERLDDYYGLLSEHFIKSENYVKGAEYSRKAARKAEKAASLDNAIAYAAKRVSCLENSLRVMILRNNESTPEQPWGFILVRWINM